MSIVARESGIGRLRHHLDRAEVLGPLFMAPAVLYMAAFLGLPFLLAIYFSLTNLTINNIHTGFSFVGLDNFVELLQDTIFQQALRNTLIFATASQLLSLILGQMTALVLMRNFRGKAIMRVLILLPWAVPIALGVLGWKWMYDSLYSIINWTLRALHILGPGQWPNWLGSPDLAMVSIILVHAWKAFPFAAVVFLGRIYELGEASGANKASKRPLTQAKRRWSKWLKPSSLQRIPTPLKRCWINHLHALSTIPLPSGNPNSLNLA